jgi:hypothetical protein
MIQGLYVSGNILAGENDVAVSNVLISRCNLGSIYLSNTTGFGGPTASAVNFLIKDCILRNLTHCYNNSQGHVFDNCIFVGQIQNITGGVTFNNGIFLKSGAYTLYSVNSATFNNCIFANPSNIDYTTHSGNPSTFNNCLFGFASFPESGGNNSGYFNNCLANVDVKGLFVNTPEQKFDYSYDYHLSDTSSAIGFGTSGTDCGIYGGVAPYKEAAVPINPHIQSLMIPAQTDGQGKLNIRVKVKAQDN